MRKTTLCFTDDGRLVESEENYDRERGIEVRFVGQAKTQSPVLVLELMRRCRFEFPRSQWVLDRFAWVDVCVVCAGALELDRRKMVMTSPRQVAIAALLDRRAVDGDLARAQAS